MLYFKQRVRGFPVAVTNCSIYLQVVSVPTFEHHAKRQHNHSAFESTFTLSDEGIVKRRLRDVATTAASAQNNDHPSPQTNPSASLSKPHVATTSNASVDVAERSGDAQSRRTGKTQPAHASDLQMSWKTSRARSYSAPATTIIPQLTTERQKRSIPGAVGLDLADLGALEKVNSATGSGKSGKDARKSSGKNKRVRSGRRAPQAAAAPDGVASGAWLEGGLPLEGMWALQVDGLDFSDTESALAGTNSLCILHACMFLLASAIHSCRQY